MTAYDHHHDRACVAADGAATDPAIGPVALAAAQVHALLAIGEAIREVAAAMRIR